MWVVAARSAFRDGRRQFVPAVTTVTDDIGQWGDDKTLNLELKR
jgi:hypothetical protein